MVFGTVFALKIGMNTKVDITLRLTFLIYFLGTFFIIIPLIAQPEMDFHQRLHSLIHSKDNNIQKTVEEINILSQYVRCHLEFESNSSTIIPLTDVQAYVDFHLEMAIKNGNNADGDLADRPDRRRFIFRRRLFLFTRAGDCGNSGRGPVCRHQLLNRHRPDRALCFLQFKNGSGQRQRTGSHHYSGHYGRYSLFHDRLLAFITFNLWKKILRAIMGGRQNKIRLN